MAISLSMEIFSYLIVISDDMLVDARASFAFALWRFPSFSSLIFILLYIWISLSFCFHEPLWEESSEDIGRCRRLHFTIYFAMRFLLLSCRLLFFDGRFRDFISIYRRFLSHILYVTFISGYAHAIAIVFLGTSICSLLFRCFLRHDNDYFIIESFQLFPLRLVLFCCIYSTPLQKYDISASPFVGSKVGCWFDLYLFLIASDFAGWWH